MSAATADPVLSRTRRRLFLTTLGLVGALVLATGAASALMGLRALDQDVDRALDAAASGVLGRFGEEAASPGEPGEGAGPASGRAPQAADTFFLVLDAAGAVIANQSAVPLGTLPDAAAVAAARATGRDLRTIELALGQPVRLLTVAVAPHDNPSGQPMGFVQAGYVLTLHDRQSRSLILAILGVGLVGLAGAALVTYWVVGRALVPIRAAFGTERRFVADASHEIRTPAAIIRSSAEVLEREDLVKPEGQPLVEGIVAEADRLGRLVDDLVALAASEQGAMRVERRPIDAAEVARATVARALPLAGERGVALSGPPADAPPLPVQGDHERLVQLLLVLLDNAFRHSPPNGHVTVSAARVGRRAEIRVDDEGPGVPPEARQTIFEPFSRLPGTWRRGDEGAGLGLAIANRLAELHGGSLGVSDAPGGGARFVLGLPIS
jgi:signal transduction histidine kinase